MSEKGLMGGGHYTCSKCNKTIFGSALHNCEMENINDCTHCKHHIDISKQVYVDYEFLKQNTHKHVPRWYSCKLNRYITSEDMPIAPEDCPLRKNS